MIAKIGIIDAYFVLATFSTLNLLKKNFKRLPAYSTILGAFWEI